MCRDKILRQQNNENQAGARIKKQNEEKSFQKDNVRRDVGFNISEIFLSG